MKNSFSLTFSPNISSLLPIYLPGRQFCRKQVKKYLYVFYTVIEAYALLALKTTGTTTVKPLEKSPKPV